MYKKALVRLISVLFSKTPPFFNYKNKEIGFPGRQTIKIKFSPFQLALQLHSSCRRTKSKEKQNKKELENASDEDKEEDDEDDDAAFSLITKQKSQSNQIQNN